ncbi:hypothetical protein [Actinoallomurus sp. NPDC052274]|uniref:hypothetical protein n=1 Tax=Actinoallomurus sp. NPDC052274 TaxID=3155420 RepID=UPI00344A24B1
MSETFWRKHPDSPFATLVRIAATYCHPEADEDVYDDLKLRARSDTTEEMNAFKQQLRVAILHPQDVPQSELSHEVQYDDGSPEKFLRRLWRDLYPGEPVPA